jgi:UDP-2,4-diacetamido-2,4,6-trideoxy-beta-L-altropyranose hydrolase
VLAQALSGMGWNIIFAHRSGTRETVPALMRSTFDHICVPAGLGEIGALRAQLTNGCDVLVVDHYDLDEEFEQGCRGWTNRIVVIDDLANRQHDCDVLVDQTIGRCAEEYGDLVQGGCAILAGPQYALIDPQFRAVRSKARPHCGNVSHVFVSFGGTDPHNATSRALYALASAKLGVTADVVLGSSSRLSAVKSLAERLALKADVHVDVADMASLLLRADIAIGAGGVSALERCCVGVPSVLLTVAENQCGNAEALAQRGAAITLGSAENVGVDQLGEAVRELCADARRRTAMSESGRRIVDGLGVERVLATCNAAPLAKDGRQVALRPAALADSALMLALQSKFGVRAFSRDPKSPDPVEHDRWVRAKLDDPDCIFNIVMHGSESVGILRFDREVDGCSYQVSILVAPERQNQRIGRAALALGKQLLRHVKIRAVINPENLPSVRMFESAGYRRADEQEWILVPASKSSGTG